MSQNWSKLKEELKTTKKPSSRYAGALEESRLKKLAKAATLHSEIDWTKRYSSNPARWVAMDCEMVGVGVTDESRLAQVCILDHRGHVLYESYAKPKEPITNYRTRYSGIRPKDMYDAPPIEKVQQEVADIIRHKKIIGHALKNDLEALQIPSHPRALIRDTAHFSKFRETVEIDGITKSRSRKLKDLTYDLLGHSIQGGEHDPYVDARAALELYTKHEEEWEKSVLVRRSQSRELREIRRGNKTDDVQRMPVVAIPRTSGDVFARGPKHHKRQ